MLHFRFVKHPKSCSEFKVTPGLPIPALILGYLLSLTPPSSADTIKVAVAENFHHLLESLKEQFHSQYGHTLELHYGTSEDLKERVSDNTQKFDLFLSADNLKTLELEQQDKVLQNSRKVYAQGVLAFWSGSWGPVSPDKIKAYITEKKRPAIHIADPEGVPYGHAAKSVSGKYGLYQTRKHRDRLIIRNPPAIHTLDPDGARYGHAAISVLGKYGLYQTLEDQDKLIINDHVSEAWTNRQNSYDAGFMPFSQVIEINYNRILFPVSVTLVPQKLYTPLLQELVILKATEHEAAAKALVEYLLSDETQSFIVDNGYRRAPVEKETSSLAQRASVEKEGSNHALSSAVSIHKCKSHYPKAAMVIVWLNMGLWILSGA